MNYFLMFITDGILGYFLQAFGYVLSLCAFTKKRYNKETLFSVALMFSIMVFAIRHITVISFGYHTVLIMISFILLAISLLKSPIFLTVISVLTTTLSVLICELLNLGVLSLIFGQAVVMQILQNGTTITDKIYKSLMGAPTNIVLVIVMYIFYRIRTRRKKDLSNGEVK